MAHPPQQLCADLPSLDFKLVIEIVGLPRALRATLEERWGRPSQEEVGSAAGSAPHVLCLTAAPGPVGLPSSELVAAELTWFSATRAELRTNGAELSLELTGGTGDGGPGDGGTGDGDGGLRAEGRIDAERPRGAVEAVVRAVTTLALAQRDVLLLHAAAVHHAGEALVLLGASGAGKTTSARRLGREGLRRLADDLIAIDLGVSPPALHRLPFERAGRALPGTEGEGVACRGGALVQKGAAVARMGSHADPVRAWAEAVIALPPAPGGAPRLLEAVERLCQLPLGVLEAPAAGPLGPAVIAWFTALRARDGAAAIPLDSRTAGSQAGPGQIMAERGQERRIERAPNVAWRVLDGAAVLVAPSSPAIQTLNEVGTLVWQLADGRGLGEIVDAVVNEFDVERTQASADVESFVQALEGRGLLISRPAPAAGNVR